MKISCIIAALNEEKQIANVLDAALKAKEKIPESALESQQQKMKNYKNAINSMTQEEIENPEVLEKQTSRLARISKGSGVPTTDIRMLIKQYKMLKEMLHSGKAMQEGAVLDQKTLMKMAKKFGKKKFHL